MTTSPAESHAAAACAHCTVPTDRLGAVCQFCANYVPPNVAEPAGATEVSEWCDIAHPDGGWRTFSGPRRGTDRYYIGNSRPMSTPTPTVPALPPGADFGDVWEHAADGSRSRVISTENFGVTDSNLVIWADAVQTPDGSLVELAARIDISYEDDRLNSDQCRELAAHLLELAALLDTWTATVAR